MHILYQNDTNNTHHPGFSFALFKQNQCVYRKYHGYSNIENRISMTNRTVFSLGSLSNSFTGIAILRLIQQKKLKFHDHIGMYLPQLCAEYRDITIQDLLEHRSGIPEYKNETTFLHGNTTNHDVYTFLMCSPYKRSSSKIFSYASTNYVLLALIIEAIVQCSLYDFLYTAFFHALGMEDTFVYTGEQEITQCAIGYTYNAQYYVPHRTYVRPYGDGGFYSTIRDMSLWINALLTQEMFTKKEKKYIAFFLKTPYRSYDMYNFGWNIHWHARKEKILYHTNMADGFHHFIGYFPKHCTGIILFTNSFIAEWGELTRCCLQYIKESPYTQSNA